MFDTLSERLGSVFDRLTKRGALSEADVTEAMREVRRALLEADVALDVVRSFTDKVRARAVGQEVIRSVTPGQMVVKIVHDQMVEMLGSEAAPIDLNAPAPVPIMMVGLQGSGKTTTTAKVARRLTNRDKHKVLMASLDTRRPAAQEQLKVLGEQAGIDTLPIIAGQTPVDIGKRALSAAMTMSPANIISMPIVNVMPCTAVTMGFEHRRRSPNGSTLSSGIGLAVAFGPKNFGMSRPAVKWSPSAQITPTQRSSRASKSVNASAS